MLIKIFIVLLPWRLKRWVLQRVFRYEIHSSARIGLAWVYPRHLYMGKESRIDHFTVAIHLDSVELGEHATIGRSNWITGHPQGSEKHFSHQGERRSRLVIGEHAAITKGHHIDCTHEIRLGRFSTIAGYQSQLLTHSVDILQGRQHSKPIEIGDYCFVSTRCIILGGARMPARSVLAAGAVLTKSFDVPCSLYGGVPAIRIKALPDDASYFHRVSGFVL